MLRTLHSDSKINILNPNLDVKMFIKSVQTYLESIFSVPFVPTKKMLWLALKTLKVWVEESVFRALQFKQPLFKVTSFKEIFLWIFNLEQKIIVPSKHDNNYNFQLSKKKIHATLFQWFYTNKSLCCGYFIFGNTFFVIHFLVSVADCGYVQLFCSYFSKNEAVKLSFTLFMFYYNII